MKNLSASLPAGTLLLLFVANPVSAEEDEAVIVTASRTAQTMDETLASVSVISREDIEQSQAHNVAELLSLQAGIDVATSGGPGTLTDVFIRGTNSNQSLVLIDGMRVSSATTGTFAWQHLSLVDVERIEIVRGPHAAQYGSDAIGGVIQIFTRQNKRGHLRGQVGSYKSWLLDAGLGGGEKVTYSLNVSARDTEGFSATNPKNIFNYNSDKDGYKNGSLTGNINIPFTDLTSLRVSGWHSNSKVEYDSSGGIGESDNTNSSLTAKLSDQTTTRWSQTLSLGLSQDDSRSTYEFFGIQRGRITTERWLLDWQHDYVLNPTDSMTLGVSSQNDSAISKDVNNGTVDYDETITDNALYAILRNHIGKNNLNLSGRVDENSNFGSHTTGQIAWGLNTTSKLRLLASYGTAFRAPTINELYYPNFGNPDLQPETSRTLEVGARYKITTNQNIRAAAYHTSITNLIQSTQIDPITWLATNIGEALIDGLELEYDYRLNLWSVQANLTWMKAIDESDKSDLIRRPRLKLGLQATRFFNDDGNISIEWVYASERDDFNFSIFPEERVTLDPYNLFNLSTRISLSKDWSLEGRLNNLTDEDYELVYGYNTAGRSIFIGVNFTPDK